MVSPPTHLRPKLHFALDTQSAVPLNPEESYLKGWFIPDDGKQYELWLIADETRVQAFTGLARPDVARHHRNNPAFKNSGFLVRFRRPKPNSPVALIARIDHAEMVLADGIAVPAFAESSAISSPIALVTHRPLISIILPVPDTHPYLVARCVESIRQQHYPQWQVCIACESLESSASHEFLGKIAREDTRLKLVSAEAGLVSELRGRALKIAEGDFVLRLDYRDELDPFALAEMVNVLNSDKHIDVVYSDEDEMDFYGSLGRPLSKPDFDPVAFSSWNFIGNGALVRRSVLLEAGGYGSRTGGFCDWDTLFRAIEITGPSRVRHIPKPLYHYRKGDDDVAPLPREIEDCPRAILDHLARIGMSATVEPGLFPGSFRLRYEREPNRRIAVLVRSEDGAFQHAALAANINPWTTRVYELLGSGADPLSDNTVSPLGQAVQKPLRNLSKMLEDVFIFINRPLDTVNHSFVDELAAQAMRADCGLVTGIALDRTGRILHSGVLFSQGELPRNLSIVRSVEEISDEFFAVKRSQLVALGGLEAVSSAQMPGVVKRFVGLAHSADLRILVTPYAVATFDVAGACDPLDNKKHMAQNESVFEPEDELSAARAERKLAAAQLREIASERNHLRRELAATEEALRRLETSRCEDLRRQIEELNAALETERRLTAAIRDSLSWRLTAPLRAGMRLVRGK